MGNSSSLGCIDSKAVSTQLDTLTGVCGSRVEQLLASISMGDIDSVTGSGFLEESFALRIFDHTSRSYISVTEKKNVLSSLHWLFGGAASAKSLSIKKKVADDGSERAPPTAFFAWESDSLVNCSCVCIFTAGTMKLHRLHVVMQQKSDSDFATLPPHIIRGDDLLNRIKVDLAEGDPCANTTFAHHFSTFGKGVTPVDGKLPDARTIALEQIKDFSSDASVSVYNHVTNKHDVHLTGTSILGYFTTLYPSFTDVSALDAPMWEVDEKIGAGHGIVFLAWRCPSSGYISGTDTFVLDSDHKIIRQYVVDVKE